MQRERFSGKTAIVTGGASGIGEVTTEGLLREGANVVIGEIDPERGEAVARRLTGAGAGRVLFVRTDVTKPDDVTALARKTVEAFGRIDILVNNAGGDPGRHDGIKMAYDDWRLTLDLNVTSHWLAMCAVVDQMAAQGGGVIVNVASMLAIRHSPAQTPAYASAKAALIRLSEIAAVRYADKKIRVNTVAPSLTLTPATRALLSEEQLSRSAQLAVLGRLGEPIEQAAAILFLCSDEASYITGHTLRVDGGWSVK